MDLTKTWSQFPLVAFDIETSGAYPVGYDIVEFGAVKWFKGQIVGQLEFFCKPRQKMSDFIIGIHGITNEMVAEAPPFSHFLPEVSAFFKDSILSAHHAPFDLGFLAWEFEKQKEEVVPCVPLCSSLLSRKLIPESPNHKLQTLIKFLNLEAGTAHRALSDAKACLQLTLECFKRAGENLSVAQIQKLQFKPVAWKNFRILDPEAENHSDILTIQNAILDGSRIRMAYDGGSRKSEFRFVEPIGLVRNPDGDYLYAKCMTDAVNKRFYLDKISKVTKVVTNS